jgi:hypothetical protein
MKDHELANIILLGLHHSDSVTKRDHPEKFANNHGVTDREQINRVCNDLHDRGLITDYWNVDTILAKISAAGIRAIQTAGENE